MRLDRTNSGRFGQWWWTVDRWMLALFMLLMAISAVLVTASSPPVAQRIGYDPYHFVVRQYVFLVLSVVVMLAVSMLQKSTIRRLAIIGLVASLLVMLLLPLIGEGTKGAIRWLRIGPLSIQPSEFMKPCFAIAVAWVLAERQKMNGFPAYRTVVGMYVIAALGLVIQPDIGMLMVLTALFGVQLFLSGISLVWVALLGIVGIGSLAGAYLFFPHVANRINGFMDPSSVDNYQVEKSLEAFASGGLLGRGPGAGEVKWSLPDAHTDFAYAVIAEEFGMVAAALVAAVFLVILLRGLVRASQSQDTFLMLALTGLAVQIGLQAFINMGVAVHLLPAKGMTLPFLSYGGSSLLAIAFTAGCLLGLSRRQFGSFPQHHSMQWGVHS